MVAVDLEIKIRYNLKVWLTIFTDGLSVTCEIRKKKE